MFSRGLCAGQIFNRPIPGALNAIAVGRRRVHRSAYALMHAPSSNAADSQKKSLKVTFVMADGEEITCPAQAGEHLLDIAHANQVDLEGACAY